MNDLFKSCERDMKVAGRMYSSRNDQITIRERNIKVAETRYKVFLSPENEILKQ